MIQQLRMVLAKSWTRPNIHQLRTDGHPLEIRGGGFIILVTGDQGEIASVQMPQDADIVWRDSLIGHHLVGIAIARIKNVNVLAPVEVF